MEALSRSKDLRLLAYLGTALLWTDGLSAFAVTLHIAAEWLDRYGSQVFPLIDEDALLRRNALNCFADPMAVSDWLRRTPLVRSRQHGSFALRDLEIAAGQLSPANGEVPADAKQIAAAFGEMSLEDLQALQERVTLALTAIKRINGVMAADGGAEMVPTLDALTAQFGKADRFLRAQLALRVPAPSEETAGDAGAPDTVQVVAVGAIRSRQDAIRALDAVATFFRNNEPSSPVPLFVERAKRLVSKDFLEVLADIAPDGLSQAKSAGGVPQE
jgi:type VI secretion system protein ImpA